MEKSVRRVSLTIMALLFMVAIFRCGDMEAPGDSELKMPDDITFETSYKDVVVPIGAVVEDSNGNGMNEIDVEFLHFCKEGDCDFIDSAGGILPSEITIATDEWGVAETRVLIYADFEGDVIVYASSGAHQLVQTTITIPSPT